MFPLAALANATMDGDDHSGDRRPARSEAAANPRLCFACIEHVLSRSLFGHPLGSPLDLPVLAVFGLDKRLNPGLLSAGDF